MRVALIGDFKGQNDEGMRHISHTIARRVGAIHTTLEIHTRFAFSSKTLRQLAQFKPDIIHYLTGPTVRSWLILFLYKNFLRGSFTISSAVRPFFKPSQYWLLRFLKPDLVLTQDARWEQVFIRQGAKVIFLPNGVELERFKPLDAARVKIIRAEYKIREDARIVLHVGHIRMNRNLELLTALHGKGNIEVVVVGSTAFPPDPAIRQLLHERGIRILEGYIPKIEEVYACAELYVFPVQIPGELPQHYDQVGVIDMPLSVLEAMACNVPVVTTASPALQRVFTADEGLRWFDGTAEDCLAQMQNINFMRVNNRAKVEPLDWSQVIAQLDQIYKDCVA